MPLSREQIFEQLQDVHEHVRFGWRSEEGEHLMPRDWRPLDSCEALFNTCKTLDVEQDARELVLAIDEFEQQFRAHAFQPRDFGSPRLEPDFARQFWFLLDEVFRLAERPHRDRRPPETVAELFSQHVPPSQIAKMYGWYTRNDEGERVPDEARVRRERENPGSEFDVETWVHPADKRFWEDIEERWAARKLTPPPQRDAVGVPVADPPRQKKPCPETLDELLEQKVGVSQILKMKPELTREDVYARATELGIFADEGQLVPQPRTRRSAVVEGERQRTEELEAQIKRRNVDVHDELGPDADARIRAMSDDGAANTDILAELSVRFPGLRMVDIEKALAAEPAAGR